MKYLAADEVEGTLDTKTSNPLFPLFVVPAMLTIKAVCQALADSPCPACCSHVAGKWIPCPNCGDFPQERKGKAYRDWQHACDALERKEGE